MLRNILCATAAVAALTAALQANAQVGPPPPPPPPPAPAVGIEGNLVSFEFQYRNPLDVRSSQGPSAVSGNSTHFLYPNSFFSDSVIMTVAATQITFDIQHAINFGTSDYWGFVFKNETAAFPGAYELALSDVDSLPSGDVYSTAGNIFTVRLPGITASAGDSLVFNLVPAVAAVPEPETYALLLAGLGLMATVARRRRNIATEPLAL